MFGALVKNWGLKLLSLILATLLWVFVVGEQQSEVGYTVPLELKSIPSGLMVANEVPSLVDVRIVGPRTLLMNLSPKNVGITVDLGDLEAGLTSFKRLDERLNIPSGLKVTRLSPSYVDVKLERVRTRMVPVRVVLRGEADEGHQLGQVRASPARVEIEGAESEIKAVNEVATEEIDIQSLRESFSQMVPLDYKGTYTRLTKEQVVEVKVEIIPPSPPPEELEPELRPSESKTNGNSIQ